MAESLLVESFAEISPCGRYRYDRGRGWDKDRPKALWVMLNPSTADASADDPTIRRVQRFSEREGCGGFVVVNLYAFRATYPSELLRVEDPVGPENLTWLTTWVQCPDVGPIIAAWGAWVDNLTPKHSTRIPRTEHELVDLLDGRAVHCLGTTASGAPRHPLYVPAAQPLIPWSAP